MSTASFINPSYFIKYFCPFILLHKKKKKIANENMQILITVGFSDNF